MKEINANVTAPMGFKAGGQAVGIKKVKKDMAIIVSEKPCVASGCFTTNVDKGSSCFMGYGGCKKSSFWCSSK